MRMNKSRVRNSIKASRNAMNRLQNTADEYKETRTGQMVIDLQIKPEKSSLKGVSDTRRRKNETVSDAGISPSAINDGSQESPIVRTVENSQVGEGLNQKVVGDDEVVIFNDQEKQQDAPHTADAEASARRNFNTLGDLDDDRPGRERRKKRYDKYATIGSASPARSLEDPTARDGHYGGDSGRFNSLILAKRIKNENSRMLQSLETRFSIL